MAKTFRASVAPCPAREPRSEATNRKESTPREIRWGYHGAAENFSAVGLKPLTCDLVRDQDMDTNDDVLVYYEDKNPGELFHCYGDIANADHSDTVLGSARYACSTVGGCTTAPASYAGQGYIRFPDITHGGNYFTTLECWMPSVYGGQASRPKSLVIDER